MSSFDVLIVGGMGWVSIVYGLGTINVWAEVLAGFMNN
jgi:hypothetical protein